MTVADAICNSHFEQAVDLVNPSQLCYGTQLVSSHSLSILFEHRERAHEAPVPVLRHPAGAAEVLLRVQIRRAVILEAVLVREERLDLERERLPHRGDPRGLLRVVDEVRLLGRVLHDL